MKNGKRTAVIFLVSLLIVVAFLCGFGMGKALSDKENDSESPDDLVQRQESDIHLETEDSELETLYFIVQKNAEGQDNYSYEYSSEDEVSYRLNFSLEELIENGSVILTEEDIVSAEVAYQQNPYKNTEPIVLLKFSEEGAEIFAEATAEAAEKGNSIGIYYEDHFISVPVVKEAISNGECIIVGFSDYAEAKEVAESIQVGFDD